MYNIIDIIISIYIYIKCLSPSRTSRVQTRHAEEEEEEEAACVSEREHVRGIETFMCGICIHTHTHTSARPHTHTHKHTHTHTHTHTHKHTHTHTNTHTCKSRLVRAPLLVHLRAPPPVICMYVCIYVHKYVCT